MFIIVEGPDGAGKSTLIEKLEKQFNNTNSVCEKLHFGVPEDPSKYYDIYTAAITQQYNNCVDVTIFDRCWYSDRVYGPVMRGKEEMPLTSAIELEQYITECGGGMIIYCDAPVEVLWARCRVRGETYITDIMQLNAIAELYKTVMSEATLPVVYYNTALSF